MRAVIQRVDGAQVAIGDQIVGSIGPGLLVLVAVAAKDQEEDAAFLARKITNLRIFDDDQGKMNLSVRDVSGQILLVSQFTLYGDCRKGNRPSYSRAAPPQQAREMYERLLQLLAREPIKVESGRFQAMMKVTLINDGPVTVIVDSPAVGG